MREELERHRAKIAELTRRIGVLKKDCVKMSDHPEIQVWLDSKRPKLLVCVKLGSTHRLLPSRVDLLKAADSRCLYSIVTAARCLIS